MSSPAEPYTFYDLSDIVDAHKLKDVTDVEREQAAFAALDEYEFQVNEAVGIFFRKFSNVISERVQN